MHIQLQDNIKKFINLLPYITRTGKASEEDKLLECFKPQRDTYFSISLLGSFLDIKNIKVYEKENDKCLTINFPVITPKFLKLKLDIVNLTNARRATKTEEIKRFKKYSGIEGRDDFALIYTLQVLTLKAFSILPEHDTLKEKVDDIVNNTSSPHYNNHKNVIEMKVDMKDVPLMNDIFFSAINLIILTIAEKQELKTKNSHATTTSTQTNDEKKKKKKKRTQHTIVDVESAEKEKTTTVLKPTCTQDEAVEKTLLL